MTAASGFRPTRWLPGPHLQTIVPALLPAPRAARRSESRLVRIDPAVALRVEVDVPASSPRGTVVLVHGLGGSADSPYLRRAAATAVGRGLIAVRVNLRGCGGTESLSATLYNAGQAGDLARVAEALESWGMPRPHLVAGWSLGGNLALLHAALASRECGFDRVAAVNPPVDLGACAARLEEPRNSVYSFYYVSRLCRHLRRVARIRPVAGPRPPASPQPTVRRFDLLYTAPDAGYPSVDAYYAAASAGPRLAGIARPTFVLSSRDDPFVPVSIFERLGRHPPVQVAHPSAGGHCGYWQAARPHDWASGAVLDFLEGY